MRVVQQVIWHMSHFALHTLKLLNEHCVKGVEVFAQVSEALTLRLNVGPLLLELLLFDEFVALMLRRRHRDNFFQWHGHLRRLRIIKKDFTHVFGGLRLHSVHRSQILMVGHLDLTLFEVRALDILAKVDLFGLLKPNVLVLMRYFREVKWHR